jgi:hypothetical protein
VWPERNGTEQREEKYKKSTFDTEIEEYRVKEYTHTLRFFCLILNQI